MKMLLHVLFTSGRWEDSVFKCETACVLRNSHRLLRRGLWNNWSPKKSSQSWKKLMIFWAKKASFLIIFLHEANKKRQEKYNLQDVGLKTVPPRLIRASGSDIFLLNPVLFKLLASKSAVLEVALRIPAELAPRLALLLGLGMAKTFES